MPLVNEAYWRDRVGTSAATWSGDRWLDWEHGTVIRSTYRRIWPWVIDVARRFRGDVTSWAPLRVLDVGAGDGRFSAWMARQFDADVLAGDAIDWPVSNKTLAALEDWMLIDAEYLHANPAVREFDPELVVFTNSLTCVGDWRSAMESAAAVAPMVMVFDNLIDPTPEWHRNLPHRTPIPNGELVRHALDIDLLVRAAKAGDVFHRRLFLRTPKWMHPATAVVSAMGDAIAGRTVSPYQARHSAWLFSRRYPGWTR